MFFKQEIEPESDLGQLYVVFFLTPEGVFGGILACNRCENLPPAFVQALLPGKRICRLVAKLEDVSLYNSIIVMCK